MSELGCADGCGRRGCKGGQNWSATDNFRCQLGHSLRRSWFKDQPAKADVQAEISRLEGQQASLGHERHDEDCE